MQTFRRGEGGAFNKGRSQNAGFNHLKGNILTFILFVMLIRRCIQNHYNEEVWM
ncbi:hypothetical protein EMIT0133MI5_10663 [Bacillus velezensis]